MKFLMTLALLCLWCFPAGSQPRGGIVSENAQTSRTTADAKLQLTTEIVKAQYFCGSGLKLDLELTFTNVGLVPVILSKRSVTLASYMVSRNVQTASDRQYEQQGRYEADFDSSAIFDPPVLSDFVVIQPREKYVMKPTRIRVDVDIRSGDSNRGLQAGNYVLEIVIGTWRYFAVDDNSRIQLQDTQFREKWHQIGFLWSDSMTSRAMPFTVDRDRISNCVE